MSIYFQSAARTGKRDNGKRVGGDVGSVIQTPSPGRQSAIDVTDVRRSSEKCIPHRVKRSYRRQGLTVLFPTTVYSRSRWLAGPRTARFASFIYGLAGGNGRNLSRGSAKGPVKSRRIDRGQFSDVFFDATNLTYASRCSGRLA